MMWPVTYDDAGEARNTAAPVISLGLPQRPKAVRCFQPRRDSRVVHHLRVGFRRKKSRSDPIDRDLMRPQLSRERPCQPFQPRLGRGVGSITPRTQRAGNRADIHDAAALSALDHPARGLTRDMKRRDQVRIHQPAHIVQRELEQASAVAYANIVDQHVEPPVNAYCIADRACHRFVIRNVE